MKSKEKIRSRGGKYNGNGKPKDRFRLNGGRRFDVVRTLRTYNETETSLFAPTKED